jgi:hypothetical protein
MLKVACIGEGQTNDTICGTRKSGIYNELVAAYAKPCSNNYCCSAAVALSFVIAITINSRAKYSDTSDVGQQNYSSTCVSLLPSAVLTTSPVAAVAIVLSCANLLS